jgi:hypothetical protein
LTRKEAIEAASKHSPMVTAVGCLAMAVVVLVDRTSASIQTDHVPTESAQIAALGNRVTALEARVGGLERVWNREERP